MEPYTITITRQFAAMGRSVATILSQDLGIEFYDRALVEEVAKRMNLTVALISGEEENAKPHAFPLGMGHTLQDDIFAVQQSIIQDIASKESSIFVGRLADSVLAQHPRHLSIYIYASQQQRLQNCVEKLGMDEEKGKKMIHDVDAARARYRKKYAPHQKEIFTNKHLMIDSGSFGIEGTAAVIAQVARDKFAL